MPAPPSYGSFSKGFTESTKTNPVTAAEVAKEMEMTDTSPPPPAAEESVEAAKDEDDWVENFKSEEPEQDEKACPLDPMWIPFPVKDWTYTMIIGFLVVCFWRGSWVLMDIWLCNQPPDADLAENGASFCLLVPSLEDPAIADLRVRSARTSYGIGIGLPFLAVTIMWSGSWLPRLGATPDGTAVPGTVTKSIAVTRFLLVYCLGWSAVNLWRGIWYWADAWILPNDPVKSYWTTSVVGSTVAFLMLAEYSLLAPPAIFLMDGPGASPPPIAVTLLSSYYSVTLPANEKPPKLSIWVRLANFFASFVLLPFAVVWFWRGSWLVLDNYLWGITIDPHDVHVSLGWGTLLFVICFALMSEPIVALVDKKITNPTVLGAFGRFRTWILAWGTVNFWRVVWLIWDEFLGGTTQWSAWTSHAIAIVGLTAMGCVSFINAPASTMGVDAVPNPKCADEPLFAMVPVPYDVLYFCAIGRQEWAREGALQPQQQPLGESIVSAGGGEVELSAVKEDEEMEMPSSATGPTGAAATGTAAGRSGSVVGRSGSLTASMKRAVLQRVRSWRPGLGGGSAGSSVMMTPYAELQRPGIDDSSNRAPGAQVAHFVFSAKIPKPQLPVYEPPIPPR